MVHQVSGPWNPWQINTMHTVGMKINDHGGAEVGNKCRCKEGTFGDTKL